MRLEVTVVSRAGLTVWDLTNSVWVVCEVSKEEATSFSLPVSLFSLVIHAHGTQSTTPPSPLSLASLGPQLASQRQLLNPDALYTHIYVCVSIFKNIHCALMVACSSHWWLFSLHLPRRPYCTVLGGFPHLFLGCMVFRGVGESSFI